MDALNIVNSSFLCGSSIAGSACPKCHPSCQDCDQNGLCTTCAAAGASKVAYGVMCLCNSGTGGDDFHTVCSSCDQRCTTCGKRGNPSSCLSCKLPGTSLAPYNTVGDCQCRDGYVPDMFPSAACTPCSGCSLCVGSDESACMSQEQAEFANNYIIRALSLPILTESADNLICYRTPLPTTGCTPDPIEVVTGPITEYETVAKPTANQCYTLLKAQWAFATYWFNTLFPNFEGPSPTSDVNLIGIKTVLKLWILHFGPAEMDTWTDIKEAMNDAGENWKNHLGWIDSNPGFTLDAGATVKAFPAKLLAWLQSSCSSTTSGCTELFNTLSMLTTVCDKAPCSSTLKGYCRQYNEYSTCAMAS